MGNTLDHTYILYAVRDVCRTVYVNHVYPSAIFIILFKYLFYVLYQKRRLTM